MARRNHDFQTIRSEGGLLPPDLLRRVLDPRESCPAPPRGLRPAQGRAPERGHHPVLEPPAQALGGVRSRRREPADRRGRHRPHQRQVEPAAAARAGLRPAAHQRRPGDQRTHLCHQPLLRAGAGPPGRLRLSWTAARPACAAPPPPTRTAWCRSSSTAATATSGPCVERPALAHPARQPGALAPVLPRVRPRGHVRRRGLLRLRAALAHAPTPRASPHARATARDLLAGAVDQGGAEQGTRALGDLRAASRRRCRSSARVSPATPRTRPARCACGRGRSA
jgi:hypothetical protein